MDVNNTRFHLLLGRRDWERHLGGHASPPDDSLVWDPTEGCVTLQPEVVFQAAIGDARLELSTRRGADRDRYGNIYYIDEDESGIRMVPHTGASEVFWTSTAGPEACVEEDAGPFGPGSPPRAPEVMTLAGLAVTEDHHLVAGVVEPEPGLLVFDLHGGGSPQRLRWSVDFRPFDIVRRRCGSVWILDSGTDGTARLWALDRYLGVEGIEAGSLTIEPEHVDVFGGESGEPRHKPPRIFPTGYPLVDPDSGDPLHPIAIAALADDSVLVLDRAADGESTVRRFLAGEWMGPAVSVSTRIEQIIEDVAGEAYEFAAHDFAFVEELRVVPNVAGMLYVVGSRGRQVFSFQLTGDDDELEIEPTYAYLPLRRFTGKALVSARGQVLYDGDDRWLPLLERRKARYETTGVFELFAEEPFDGIREGCLWHRLFLDACIPPGTSISVETRAADTIERLRVSIWNREPAPYLRGADSEIPYYRPFDARQSTHDGTGTWETLFQRATGRFLQIRLTFQGDGRHTPRLHALRAYYERFSYLTYLPAVFREDRDSASLLDRFLANPEGTFSEIEGKIADVQSLFDTRIIGDGYLEWLARWIGVVLDPALDVRRRRLFIDHAVELFSRRGTPGGLARVLRLFLDPCPGDELFEPGAVGCNIGEIASACTPDRTGSVRIVEDFPLRSVPGVVFGDPGQPVPGLVEAEASWSPDQGIALLQAQYRDFLRNERGKTAAQAAASHFTPLPPSNAAARADWTAFVEEGLGFTYAEVVDDDTGIYREFLVRRYRLISNVNAAYGTNYGSFNDVDLPTDTFPPDGPALADWIVFTSLIVPIRRRAHSFIVLVSTDPEGDLSDQADRLALAERIVEVEKPAHTSFVVRPFWSMFQVGVARVGFDTYVDRGSRYFALVLGRDQLGYGFLASAYPFSITDRFIVGRDVVSSGQYNNRTNS